MIIEINTIDKTVIVKSEFQLYELTDVIQTYNLWDYKIIMDKKQDYIFHPVDPIPNVNPWKPDIVYNNGIGSPLINQPFTTSHDLHGMSNLKTSYTNGRD